MAGPNNAVGKFAFYDLGCTILTMTPPPRSIKHSVHSPLFWLVALYLLVGLTYAWVTPLFEKPDEDGHYGYLLYLREHNTLPPLVFGLEFEFEYKQPPLYYLVTHALTSWLPATPERMPDSNPYMNSSVPVYRNDNRNVFLHPPSITPLVLAARLVSWLFGLGTMLSTYYLATQLFPQNTRFAIAAAGVVGFQPQALFIATAINNDTAIAFFGALATAILVRRLKTPPSPYFAPLLGGVLGLASLTKVSGLAFFPLAGLALIFIHRGIRPALFRDGAIIIAVALLTSGWWYARNALVYGDPLTVHTHSQIVVQARPIQEHLRGDLYSIERTFWTNLSRTFISPSRMDQALIWWGRISLGLLVLLLTFKYPHIKTHLPSILILLSWPVTFFALLVLFWAKQAPRTYGRLLLPAIAPLGILLLWGWQAVFPAAWQRLSLTLGAGAVIVISTLIPFASLWPLYNPSREWQASQVEHPVGLTYVDGETGTPIARLIGYNLPGEPYALRGDYFPLELCWEPLGRSREPYAVFVQFLEMGPANTDNAPTIWGRRETYPGLGNRPTDRWPLQRAFCDLVWIPVSPDTPTPLGVATEVGFIDSSHTRRLAVTDRHGTAVSLALAGGIAILSPDEAEAIQSGGQKRPARYILDRAIGLDEASFSGDARSATITLTWQSLQSVPYDATVFVHLKRADGSTIAQADRPPLDGRFPTSYWLPGQIITDVVTLSLAPSTSPPVSAHLAFDIGMYTWPSMQRLGVTDSSGTPQPNDVVTIQAMLR